MTFIEVLSGSRYQQVIVGIKEDAPPHDPSITPSHPPPGIASDMEAGSFELVKYWMTRTTLTVFKKIRQNDMEQKLFFLNTIHLFVSVTA